MKILFVCPTDPRETSYGGQQRTHVLWKGLQSVGDVWTVVPVPHKWQEERDEQSRIYKLCLERRYTLGWFAQRLLSRFIPYWNCSWAYDWKRLHRQFADVDVVVARYIKMAAAFKLWKLAPLYVDGDDIHTLEFDLYTKEVGNSLKRRIQRKLLGCFQDKIYRKARLIWVPAMEQVGLLPQYPFAYLPNIPCGDLPDYSKTLGDENTLFFVGLMSSEPNQVAVDWFLKSFWSRLKVDFPAMRLRIAGGGLPAFYRAAWTRFADVEVLGFQKDILSHYRNSLALVTPMQIGMGSCIKVLESLSIGRCVLSTGQGLRGIQVSDRDKGNGIFEFCDYETLRAALQSLRESACRSATQQGAVLFVGKQFSFEEICRRLKRNLCQGE